MGGGIATGEMNYSDMSQEEVDELIREKVPEKSSILEIRCGGMSAVTFGKMLKKGYLLSYFGMNTEKKGVDETRAQRLTAHLVKPNQDYSYYFEKLERVWGDKAVVAMFELSEKEPEVARRYAKQARDVGIKRVVSYPEI